MFFNIKKLDLEPASEFYLYVELENWDTWFFFNKSDWNQGLIRD